MCTNNHPAEVVLIFPPLVETNFGNVYPSTAVLAAYLRLTQTNVVQLDLNEEYAEHLLRPEVLSRWAAVDPRGSPDWSAVEMSAVAARLLSSCRSQLFDAQGRHDFGPESNAPAHLLQILASRFRIDEPIATLVDPAFRRSKLAAEYQEFYTRSVSLLQFEGTRPLVGISVAMGPQLGPSLLLAGYLKTVLRDARIILGGPTLSLADDASLQELLVAWPEVDAIVRYDGEVPLARLLDQHRTGNWNPSEIAGVFYLGPFGGHSTPPAPGPDLGGLPPPDYDSNLLAKLARPELGVVQARGCYWGRCAYCDYVELYRGSPKYRTRSPESFVDEVTIQIRRYAAHRFLLITEAIPPGFARRASQLILERGLQISWKSFAMVDRHFTVEVLEQMARSGCDALVVGVETMTDRVLRQVDKAATASLNQGFLRRAKAAGIQVTVNIIPDLPSTTAAEAEASLHAFQAVEDCIARASVFPFEPTRSSEIGRDPKRFGLTLVPDLATTGQAQFAGNHLGAIDDAMSPDEHASAHAAARAFADRINARFFQNEVRNDTRRSIAEDETLIFGAAWCDIFETADGIQYYNALSRDLMTLPSGWAPIFGLVKTMGQFRRADFVRRFSPEAVGLRLLAQLAAWGLVIRAEGAMPKDSIERIYDEGPRPATGVSH